MSTLKSKYFGPFLITAIALVSRNAYARTYDIYRSDYAKGAFCSVIAGACSSDDDQESAYFQNPASLTVAKPDYSYDIDYERSGNVEIGAANNHNLTETRVLGGYARSGEHWGLGLAMAGRFTDQKSVTEIYDSSNSAHEVNLRTQATTLSVQIPFAYRLSAKTSVGISLVEIYYQKKLSEPTGKVFTSKDSSSLEFPGFIFGAVHTFDSQVRVGSWFRTAMHDNLNFGFNFESYGSATSYSESIALHYPWILANGVSYSPWSDDRTFLGDLDLIGTTSDGYLLNYDSFSSDDSSSGIKGKGRVLSLEPRLGYRTQWSRNSKGALFMGAFWEPDRTQTSDGKLHETLGVSYKIFSDFELLGGIENAKNFFRVYISFR